MTRIFTLLFISLFTSLLAQSQVLTCPSGVGGGTSSTYNATVPQTFTTAAWGTSNGSFTYSAAQQNYQSNTGAGGNATITSPFLLVAGNAPFIVGALISPGNRVNSYLIEILQNGTVINCFAGGALSTGNAVGIAASFSNLGGRTIQIRFTFQATSNQGATFVFDNFYTNPELTVTPVEFVSFKANKLTSGTQLNWQVGEEDNVSRYEIEKNSGNGFVSIGSVPAGGLSIYTFTDPNTSQGQVQYRIRNVDRDGNYKYSTILGMKNGVASLLLKAFPLPAQNTITVQHNTASASGKISLAAPDGRVVKLVSPATGSMQTTVNLSGLNAGMYVLRFDAGDGLIEAMKIMKQ